MTTVVWTDGSWNANGLGRGGWAALIEHAGTVRELYSWADGVKQHRMELTAVCEALEPLTGAVEVRTDTLTSRSASTRTGMSGGCAITPGRDRRAARSTTEISGSGCSGWSGTEVES